MGCRNEVRKACVLESRKVLKKDKGRVNDEKNKVKNEERKRSWNEVIKGGRND